MDVDIDGENNRLMLERGEKERMTFALFEAMVKADHSNSLPLYPYLDREIEKIDPIYKAPELHGRQVREGKIGLPPALPLPSIRYKNIEKEKEKKRVSFLF